MKIYFISILLISTVSHSQINLDIFERNYYVPDAAYAFDAFKAGDYERCIKIADEALFLFPNDLDAYFVKGRCYERMLEFEKSWQQYDFVAKREPTYKDVQHNRVLLSLKQLNFKRALQEIKIWKKVDPSDKRIKYWSDLIEKGAKSFEKYEKDKETLKQIIKAGYQEKVEKKEQKHLDRNLNEDSE